VVLCQTTFIQTEVYLVNRREMPSHVRRAPFINGQHRYTRGKETLVFKPNNAQCITFVSWWR